MYRFASVVMFLALLSYQAVAADEPRAEVFGGYQYLRLDTGVSGIDSFNLNGWNAALNGYFTKHIGFTADFSGAYGTPDVLGVGIDTKVYTFMFGPVVRLPNPTHLTPFFHALGGGVHFSGSALGTSASETDAAWAVGGGLDWNATQRFSIRLGQFDYVQSRAGDSSQNNLRYSAGVVIKF